MDKPTIRDAEQRTQTICLLILSAIAIGVALMQLRQVLVPFVLALFLTMAVTPVMDVMIKRLRLPRGVSIVATIGLATLGLALLGALVSTALREVLEKKETYVEQIDGLIFKAEQTFASVQGGLENWMPGESKPVVAEPEVGDLTRDLTEVASEPQGSALGNAKPAEGASPFDDMRKKVGGMALRAIGWTVNNTLALMSQGLLVMVFMMFLITGYRTPDASDTTSLSAQLRKRIKEYLRVKIIVSAITGGATFVILNSLGVDLALVFGLMAFFLNFIPNVGSAVAILLPLPVILLAPSAELSIWAKCLGLALPAVVQFLVGNVLEPRWMGRSLDLNPIVILLSLIFWGVLWGPVGMLLSVPMTVVLKILLERSALTQPVAKLFAEAQ